MRILVTESRLLLDPLPRGRLGADAMMVTELVIALIAMIISTVADLLVR